jgi:ribonuclease HI
MGKQREKNKSPLRQKQKKISVKNKSKIRQATPEPAMKIVAYFDGACEPINPGGYAAFGAVIFIDGVQVWKSSTLFVPQKGREEETSNNVAEYAGFIAILVPLALQAQKLLEQFPKIQGEWIPRVKNSIADELSKAELIKAGISFRIQPNG